jgi:hypothetical protein
MYVYGQSALGVFLISEISGTSLINVAGAKDEAMAQRICDLLNRNGLVDVPLTETELSA